MNACSKKQAVQVVEAIRFQRIPWKDILITLAAAVSAGLSGALVLSLVVFLLAAEARAGDAAEAVAQPRTWQNPQVGRGSLLLHGLPGDGAIEDAPLLSTDVVMDVAGILLRARVRQVFENRGKRWLEGIYVFPLPDDAAVDRLTMHYGDRVIEGEIKEKARARKRYTQAKRAGKKAGLVSQERPNVFTSEVANIAPGERVSVEIEYQQTLDYDKGRFSLRFPMVVAPRYIPGAPLMNDQIIGFSGSGWADNTTRVEDAARITPPVREQSARAGNPVSLSITLALGMPLTLVESPYHAIEQSLDEQGVYRIRLAADEVPADRDFELIWVPRADQVPRAALFSERWAEHDYALLMVMPPTQASRAAAQPREIVFVLDTSGSMHGASMVQAKAALSLALGRLKPDDRFNVVRFNHRAAAFFDHPVPATPSHLRQAIAYVQGLEAEGGTEMLPAIHLALDGREHPGIVRQVIFLTDGSVGNETELFEAIERRLGSSRLFTLGIGSAPNGYFMTRAAEHGRGTFTFIGDVQEVEAKMTALFTKLEHPMLTDIQVHWPADSKAQMWPDPLPDLYLGEPLVLAARMPKLEGEVSIEGILGSRVWQRIVRLQGGGGNSGIHGLWARRKIASLMTERNLGRAGDEVRAEVLDVALEHGLVSRYTSLVAVDKTPVRPRDRSLESKPIPINMPAGWHADKVFGTLPQTATPAPAHLLLGLAGLLAGWWLRRRLVRIPNDPPIASAGRGSTLLFRSLDCKQKVGARPCRHP